MEQWRKVVRLYAFSLLAHRQWGLSRENSSNPATVSLPISYTNKQVCAIAIDWGASGKAYGIRNMSNTNFDVVAPNLPFSVYFVSLGQ